jgi:ABC-2 type transport system permease protein
MRALLAIVRVSLRQALGGKRLVALGLVGIVPTIVMVVTANRLTPDAMIARFYDGPFGILFYLVMPITSMVIGAGAMGDERRDGTLSFLLLRPIPRWEIIGAKLVAAWSAVVLVAGGSAVLAAVALGVRSGYWTPVLPILIGISISGLGYTAVFLILGHITSRAVLIGLVYNFIWESGITGAAPALANVSLLRIGMTAYAAMVPASQAAISDMVVGLAPGPFGAVAKSVVIAVLAVLALGWILRTRDAVSE